MTAPAPRTIAAICGSYVGKQFTFAPWSVDQASTLVAAWTDAEIARWNPVPPEPTLELAESWICSTASQNEASVGIDVTAMVGGQVVGELGLQVDPAQAIAEVGFWTLGANRRSGVGRALLDFAEWLAAELELVGLVALIDAENAGALGLIAAQGWTEIPTKSDRRGFAYRTGS